MSEYAESVCNNQKLAREIRETLQILLMREKNDIEILKSKTISQAEQLELSYNLCNSCKRNLDSDVEMTDSGSVAFLEDQVSSLLNLKETLEQEIQFEYNENRILRKEVKDLSDISFDLKEKSLKLSLENQELKLLLKRSETLSDALDLITQEILKTKVCGIKDTASNSSLSSMLVQDIITSSLNSNSLWQQDRQSYIDQISKLEQDLIKSDENIKNLNDLLCKSQLKIQSLGWVNSQMEQNLKELKDCIKEIKEVVYEEHNMHNGTEALEIFIKGFKQQWNKMKEISKASRVWEMQQELERLKEKDSEIQNLLEVLRQELELEKKKDKGDAKMIEEFAKLKESKEKDKESYEGEIRELKRAIAETDTQKEKDSVFANKLKSDNIKLFKQNKEMAKQIEEIKISEGNLNEAQKLNQELQDQLTKANQVLEQHKQKESENNKQSIEEENFKQKYDEIVKQYQENLDEQIAINKELNLKISNLELALQQKQEEINNEMNQFNKRAVIALKKAKEVVEKAKGSQQFPVSVPKPPTSIIKRKREAKDKNKEDEMIPEKLPKNS